MDSSNGSSASASTASFVGILQEAAYSGRVSLVRQLLDDGADINAVGGFNGTALQAAAYGGHKAVVALLLQRDVDVDAVGGFYGSALQAAAYGDHEEVVKLLLDANANVNMESGEYGTALRAAAYKGHEAVVQLLLQKGADINAHVTDLDELSRETGSALQAAAREGHYAVVQILIDQGAEVNAIGGYFGTALQAAASEGHEEVIQLLLDNGADINAVGGEFGTALQAAACEGHEGVVELLIECGADVNIEGGEFGSALEAADCEGHETVVQILVASGAKVNPHGDHLTNALRAAASQIDPTVANVQNNFNILGRRIRTPRRTPNSSHRSSERSTVNQSTVIDTLPELSYGNSIATGSDHIANNYELSDLRDRIQNLELVEVIPERIAEQSRRSDVTMGDKKSGDISDAQSPRLPSPPSKPPSGFGRRIETAWRRLRKFGKFIGPGYMIAVGYIDPGNFSTDVSAGSAYRFKLLFVILLANLCAIFLQSLCVRLGTVTGLNLAEHCRAHLPRWMNYSLYFLAESAIIATDIAEVIGSAIALNILLKIPLVAGCALTLVDVLVILLFYNPNGSTRHLRYFEYFVMAMVLGIMVCFFIQLSYIDDVQAGEVFRGYVPSASLVQSNGLYLSCGILGATVMPHNLYLGSGVVQARLHEFDVQEGNLPARPSSFSSSTIDLKYRPSLAAIRSCMGYSIAELVIALVTFAFFVNSAILITAGASLSGSKDSFGADLFGIHDLLTDAIAPAAGTIFAVSLLLSGTSAGIVATIAGQMVSEGSLKLTCSPWLRRLLTRTISIAPSIIIASAVGREGLSAALNGSQIMLSVILPFVSAPLIYFTCRNKYMTVSTIDGGDVKMRNHWIIIVIAILIWLTIVLMDVAFVMLFAMGKICGFQGCRVDAL